MNLLTEHESSSNLSNNDADNDFTRNNSKTDKKEIQKFQEMKAIVNKAVKNHETFTVLGPFSCIRAALKLRGWIEKFEIKSKNNDELRSSHQNSLNSLHKSDNIVEDIFLSRLLRNYDVDFIWTMKNEPIKWKKLHLNTTVSRLPRADFTTKVGLCNNLQQPYWYYEENISKISFPRCYNISNEDELAELIYDFRLTACINMIKFIQEAEAQEKIIFDKSGTIPLTAVNFAIQRCEEYLLQQQHVDIDQEITEKVWNHQWDQFLTYYYLLIHENYYFIQKEEFDISVIQEKCKNKLQILKLTWPQFELDGTHNLWILKPAAKSRGRGILIMKKLEDIQLKLGSSYSKDNRYIAQKYIERPLLIYETKFDIRQWFLVTCAFPLTVWMYKESYLRFCSQLFCLKDTHESVHLSNNAVQCRYKNCKRNSNLPEENMWDCYTFQTYLRSKGQPKAWETVIYPGMCQNIVGTLLASQDGMDSRKNCFELFGADFMLTENLTPWLIEINSGPSMSASTSVTARMCAQVLDDVIKDKKIDKNADTGMFELVYKQVIPPAQLYMGQNLIIKGARIEKLYRKSSGMTSTIKYTDKLIFAKNRSPKKSDYLKILKYKPTNRKYKIRLLQKLGESFIQHAKSRQKEKTEQDKKYKDCWETEILVKNSNFYNDKNFTKKVIENEKENNLFKSFGNHQFPYVNSKKKANSTMNQSFNENTLPRINIK